MVFFNHKNFLVNAVMLIAVIAVFNIAQQQNQIEKPEKVPFDLAMIRSGDLIFRQGRGIFSEFFRNVGEVDSPYSHVGIIYVKNNNVFVIHTEANEMTGIGFAKKDKLVDFISNNNALTYGLFRIKGLGNKDAESVLKTALAYVSNKIPFDADFNLKSSDSLYCTELVYKAYKSAGFDLVEYPLIIHLPVLNGLLNLKAITVGQLVESEAIKLISKLK